MYDDYLRPYILVLMKLYARLKLASIYDAVIEILSSVEILCLVSFVDSINLWSSVNDSELTSISTMY